MPKQISQHELDLVLSAVSRFASGAGIQRISEALAGAIPRRTLQRRLAGLVAQQRLTVRGQGRASIYLAPIVLTVASGFHRPQVEETSPEAYVPMSSDSEAVRALIRQPLHLRPPVSYNREFLDSYRPNQTFYLSSEHRLQLATQGRGAHAPQVAGTYLRQILDRLLIDLAWNSSRLEGNTYSLLETEQLLAHGQSADGKNALEAQMIVNHKEAIEFIAEPSAEIGINPYTILNLHALLSDNLLANPAARGRLRNIAVGVGSSVYHPLAVPQLIAECFNQLLDTANAIVDPFEQAFFLIVHLPYLQPFEDVNKRVSRLAVNLPLLRENLSPLSFIDVPGRAYIEGLLAVYELNRVELLRDVFMWAYQRSSAQYSAVRQSLGEPDPFRMKYRQQVVDMVVTVVKTPMNQRTAIQAIAAQARQLIEISQQARFIEVVESELRGLHPGNIAPYRVRPSEFDRWNQGWR